MILLDTATWIWANSDPGQLSPAATDAIRSFDEAYVSAISAWEIGLLVAKGRIVLDRPTDRWVDDAFHQENTFGAPVDHHIGVLATQLPADPPHDPADRIIIATALHRGLIVVTPDRQIQDYPFCPTIW